jgi:hypothetical protein
MGMELQQEAQKEKAPTSGAFQVDGISCGCLIELFFCFCEKCLLGPPRFGLARLRVARL